MLHEATACLTVAVTSALLSAACYASYRRDQSRLRRAALAAIPDEADPAERAIRLMSWVYRNRGFGKNRRYFLIRRLGPTPAQVLEEGGDCADKSRLLSSMLRSIGIRSTLAMCLDGHGRPTHTVVDARLPDGTWLLLDPTWGLHFPREGGGHFGLLDLRREPTLLWRRLDAVLAGAAPDAKVRRYNRRDDVYDAASTFNWDRRTATRAARVVLERWIGDRVYALPRPAFLEEPKLFVAIACLLLAVAALAGLGVVRAAVPPSAGADRHGRSPSPVAHRQATQP